MVVFSHSRLEQTLGGSSTSFWTDMVVLGHFRLSDSAAPKFKIPKFADFPSFLLYLGSHPGTLHRCICVREL